MAYASTNIELVPVRPSGGMGVVGKLDALHAAPSYVATLLRELKQADIVHVRAPANIAMVAMLLLSTRQEPRARWFKYAGNWRPTRGESPSYTMQRLWLQHAPHHGVVTINGEWPDQAPWIRTFYNPSLDDEQLNRGRDIARHKRLAEPVRLLYVGQLLRSKGAGRAIEVLARLRARSFPVMLEVIGDGPDAAEFQALAGTLGVDVAFRGWQAPAAVHDAYREAHVLLLPSESEGWPKVLSEGMAYGLVPVAGAVGSIPQYLRRFGTGAGLDPTDVDGFAAKIATYIADPAVWLEESRRAVEAARCFSYSHYLESVDVLLRDLGCTAGPVASG